MQAELSNEDVFRAFKKCCPDVPTGEIVYSDKPDVLIRGKDITYGFEITQIY